MSKRYMSHREFDAILAGLRLVQYQVEKYGALQIDFQEIYEASGQAASVEEIDQLVDDLLTDQVQLHVVDTVTNERKES